MNQTGFYLMSTITFSLFPTAPALHRDVECIRLSVHTGTKALTTKTCPNGLPGIVFQMGRMAPPFQAFQRGLRKFQICPLGWRENHASQ